MFKTILVGFKNSKGGLLALETGAQLAREQGAGLHVFHAMDYQLQRLEPSDPEIQECKLECENQVRKETLPHLPDLDEMDFHCLPDDPAMGICLTAVKLKADLIILGEHHTASKMSLARLDYIGMTVVEKAPCPVMIVPFR